MTEWCRKFQSLVSCPAAAGPTSKEPYSNRRSRKYGAGACREFHSNKGRTRSCGTGSSGEKLRSRVTALLDTQFLVWSLDIRHNCDKFTIHPSFFIYGAMPLYFRRLRLRWWEPGIRAPMGQVWRNGWQLIW